MWKWGTTMNTSDYSFLPHELPDQNQALPAVSPPDKFTDPQAIAQVAKELYWQAQTHPQGSMMNPTANAGDAGLEYGHHPGSLAPHGSPTAAPSYFDDLLNEFYADVPNLIQQAAHTWQHPEQFDPVERLQNCRAFYYLQKFANINVPAPAAPPPSAGTDLNQNYYLVSSPTSLPVNPYGLPVTQDWDVYAIRKDFPILHQKINGKPLIWLDNAATSQKPIQVIEALEHFYQCDNSNVHRGAHSLAARATDGFEGGREKVQQFLGAASPREIIFVRNATEAINLVAQTYGRKYIQTGDEIVLTHLEHHANIVPWQMLAQETGAVLRIVPLNERGEVILEEYERLLSSRTRMVAIAHVSNALGTVLPVQQMVAMARRFPTRVLIDGAQSVPHFRVNVQSLDADFYVFSGHKLFAPTGIGALYGKLALLEDMPPWQGGGSMIENVTFEETTYNKVPYKFEAGTNHIAGAVGLGAAIDYLNQIDFEAAAAYEEALTAYATQGLATVPGLRQIGTSSHKVSVLSFVMDGISNEDIGQSLNQEGIAVRAGHHCAQPALRHFGLNSTVRPSVAFYNTPQEIDVLVKTLHKIARSRR